MMTEEEIDKEINKLKYQLRRYEKRKEGERPFSYDKYLSLCHELSIWEKVKK